MEAIVGFIENITERSGKAISWLSLLLVLLICVDVFMRYVFDFTLIWVIELEIYFFAFLFLIGSAYAFKHDKHVRVDVFYQKKSEKGKAWINLLGGLFFLLPWCAIVLWVSYNYAWFSLQMNEGSAQPGGLPALYILKFSISIAFALLLLQCIASILKSLIIIRKN